MTIPNSAKNYLLNGASSGERNDTMFHAACQLRDSGHSQQEVVNALMERATVDGLDAGEVMKTVSSVFSRPAREEAVGAKSLTNKAQAKRPVVYKSAPKGDYKIKKKKLPKPIPDGARKLLKEAFREDENVRIVFAAKDEESGRIFPANEGNTRSREWWLKKLDSRGGNLDGYNRDLGVYVTINPLKPDGSKDQDVTRYCRALVEFDDLDLEEQWHIITTSNIPCTAVMTSGGKSLHAWVNLGDDVNTRAEYDKKVKLLMDHLADHVDSKNKNPSRLSRLPNSKRGTKRQELLALNIGAKSWGEWESHIKCAAIWKRLNLRDLDKFDPKNDPNNQLGERWICKGGSCLFVAQSGVGKSSMAMQLSMHWALGRSCFGIKPERPLRSLLIQAENDLGDVAEMFQGVKSSLQIEGDEEAFAALESNFIPITEDINTGPEFGEAARHLIGAHKPDLVWLDPLLSFIGDDISKQDVCSNFLRGMLNPIAHETGVSWMMVHHTPKPSTDPRSKSGWITTDHSYAGTGSAELTNWARAVCLLRTTKDEGFYELLLAKRGKRAGAKLIEGDRTQLLHLKHSDEGICWEQRPKPVVVANEPAPKRKAAPKKRAVKKKVVEKAVKIKPTKEEISATRSAATTKEIHDLEGLVARITEPMTKSAIYRLSEKHGHGSAYLLRKDWSKVEAHLIKNKKHYQRKADQ